MHSVDKCFECPLGKKKKDELLAEADSVIDAASDFVYWQINECNHEFCNESKNKEVNE